MQDLEKSRHSSPKGLRLWFAIFMVLIYLGMGVFIAMDKVDVFGTNTTVKYIVGCVLVVYGIYRGYRLMKGSN